MKRTKMLTVNKITIILFFCLIPFSSIGNRSINIHLCNDGIFSDTDSSLSISFINVSDTVIALKDKMTFTFTFNDEKNSGNNIILIQNKKYSIPFELSLFAECEPYYNNTKICIKKIKGRKYRLAISYCNSIGDVIILSKRQIAKKK